ncbi:RND family efflux transporter MFP subunit [Inquilinus ginsengisoli]|uniref:RND family efflux transporter MFP subunit n=1 Tax=Inquilinus ginsengisoli TaxID=363840 RepID=A0ABU1JRM6_9PROT|nr:efflux RND transporter periplasmic adaptor subunit [Inquilinus ginsengisoli]MDR6291266.1 RND family efflux transporter MFP subunit [Inquilinus ginsengisoli]
MGRPVIRTLAGVVALALVGGLAGLGWQASRSTAATTAQAAVRPAPSVIVSPPLVRRVVDQQEYAGRFEPTASVEIRARVSGHLQSIGFEDGQIVQAGQTLFTIDPRPYQAAVAEAQAQLSSARAQRDLADLELRRAEQLAGTSAVSRATLDQRRQQKQAADAASELAQAGLMRAQLDLDFTEIKAPISGRVSNRRVDAGSLVSDASTLLTTIVALDPIYFVFDMSERDFVAYERAVKSGDLRPIRDQGVPIAARLEDDDGWPYRGTMSFVDNRLESGAGTIRARAVLANADLFITPGQFGRLRLASSGERDALLVPETALLTDQASRIVLTVADDDTLRATPVRLGARQPGGLRVVESGLRPQDRVVINGLLRARAGQKVVAQPGEIAPAATALVN